MKYSVTEVLWINSSDIEQNEFYAVISDITQELNVHEQESFYVRHVDSDLNLRKIFIGLYEVPNSTVTFSPYAH